MKKNIFSVIITALTVVNVVLTAIMFFVMMPTFQKSNKLITQVASVLNIELDPGDHKGGDQSRRQGDKGFEHSGQISHLNHPFHFYVCIF